MAREPVVGNEPNAAAEVRAATITLRISTLHVAAQAALYDTGKPEQAAAVAKGDILRPNPGNDLEFQSGVIDAWESEARSRYLGRGGHGST